MIDQILRCSSNAAQLIKYKLISSAARLVRRAIDQMHATLVYVYSVARLPRMAERKLQFRSAITKVRHCTDPPLQKMTQKQTNG